MTDIYLAFFSFLFSCVIASYAVPSLIKLAYHKALFDDPTLEERKIHKHRTPNLGGIAVLTALVFTACLCISSSTLPYGNYILASGLLIFLVGLKDDLAALNPYKKFFAQSVSALIMVHFADIRLTSFYGIFGIYEINPVVGYLFTCLFIVFIINAFNLIDGINGLLGSVSLIVGLTFGYIFFQMQEYGLAILAISMAGSVLGFLRFNAGNAQIFMGDAGAYTIGFIVSIFTIQFIELSKNAGPYPVTGFAIQSVPAVAIAILIIPIFDTLRVIVIRLTQGRSPFTADRNHLHHRLLETGMTHTQATLSLSGFNMLMIGTALSFQHIGTVELLILMALIVLLMNTMLWLYDVRPEIPQQPVPAEDDDRIYQLRDHTPETAEALPQYEEKQHQN
ncbi:UDP-N-acetylmuramyl pentapeptide phosphotransferase/UDP-N-acetylglucosamine-1-phosphate transferase [Parapedobacter composti]|uniref:UDP-N-acetylmuramyl pentapeptide phosphotransferase/UDP-N-acetylglucosamine-1-phosphate transferase n=1 Tax=Parapedobacter composti TaxID=623281 RepID=A0A1I1G1G1_9SPHI|nr:MraY family glycosyltransferase [Parapedobacter composti]SFC03143.1 UDP-N-acetylmuramyl pentapeptide phosphotransferase/UDP-N-acetylglucosamine-1-phosphate transferase [Parapedobacter composti]